MPKDRAIDGTKPSRFATNCRQCCRSWTRYRIQIGISCLRLVRARGRKRVPKSKTMWQISD